MRKYELTANQINITGTTLYQIRAIRDFGGIKRGDIGGYIQSENNLSHNGNAWVYGNARVRGNARVCDNADIYKDTHILQCGPLGSRYSTTTFYRTKNKSIYVSCGCFNNSIEEFAARVNKVHIGTKHQAAYQCAISLAKTQIELDD